MHACTSPGFFISLAGSSFITHIIFRQGFCICVNHVEEFQVNIKAEEKEFSICLTHFWAHYWVCGETK